MAAVLVIVPLIFISITLLKFLTFYKKMMQNILQKIFQKEESMSNISSDASNLERLNRWNVIIKLFLNDLYVDGA